MNYVNIHNTQLPIVEYRGQRVVTLAMIDQAHERPEGTAKRNFSEHRARLIDGQDFYLISAAQRDEFRSFGLDVPNRGLTILTEQGYLMLVKSLTDDLAWTVQRQLVSSYFRVSPAQSPALPGDYISALEHLLESKRSEQLAIEERNRAIETKAEIGSRREATAMATASIAVRQVKQLKSELGLGTAQASVLAVEKATGRKFGISGYVPLRHWCKARGLEATKVLHPTFGTVRSWPAGAWMDVYQIDIAKLFAAELREAV